MKTKRFLGLLAVATILGLASCNLSNFGFGQPSSSEVSIDWGDMSVPSSSAAASSAAGRSSTRTSSATQTFNFNFDCPSSYIPTLRDILNDFANDYSAKTGKTVTFNFRESDSYGYGDIPAARDLYLFSSEYVGQYAQEGRLTSFYDYDLNDLSILDPAREVCSYQGQYVAFPFTLCQGPILLYNRSYFPASTVETWSGLLQRAKTQKVEVHFNYSSAWYNAGFFFGTGAESRWETDGDGNFTGYVDTYDGIDGVDAAKGLLQVAANSVVVDNASFWNLDDASNMGAIVSGPWDYERAYQAWGSNLKCAKLPMFQTEGGYYPTYSFSRYELIGLTKQNNTERERVAKEAAKYICSYDAQIRLLQKLGLAPIQNDAVASTEVQNIPYLVAQYEQNEYAKPQGLYPGDWWTHAGNIGTYLHNLGLNATDEDIRAVLREYSSHLSEMAPGAGPINPDPIEPSVEMGSMVCFINGGDTRMSMEVNPYNETEFMKLGQVVGNETYLFVQYLDGGTARYFGYDNVKYGCREYVVQDADNYFRFVTPWTYNIYVQTAEWDYGIWVEPVGEMPETSSYYYSSSYYPTYSSNYSYYPSTSSYDPPVYTSDYSNYSYSYPVSTSYPYYSDYSNYSSNYSDYPVYSSDYSYYPVQSSYSSRSYSYPAYSYSSGSYPQASSYYLPASSNSGYPVYSSNYSYYPTSSRYSSYSYSSGSQYPVYSSDYSHYSGGGIAISSVYGYSSEQAYSNSSTYPSSSYPAPVYSSYGSSGSSSSSYYLVRILVESEEFLGADLYACSFSLASGGSELLSIDSFTQDGYVRLPIQADSFVVVRVEGGTPFDVDNTGGILGMSGVYTNLSNEAVYHVTINPVNN